MIQEKTGRLIVVDDEIETLTPLCDLLSEWGYEVTRCTSGNEALESFKKQQFDVMLTDLVMPEMDGIAIIREAMKLDPLLVSIIITGHGTIQTAVEAMKLGAFDYLTKPLEWKLLGPTISRAVEIRRLRESEKKYRTIVEDQTELVCRWKPGEILTYVNEVYCKYFHKKPEELIGRSFMPLVLEEDHERVRQHFASLTPGNPVSTLEHRVLCPEGERCWQQWTNRAIFDEKGNIIEYQSVGRDITDRKLAEEALRDSEARYRDIYDNAPDMYYTLDENGVILNCNKTEARMIGYEKEEIIGKHITDFFTEKSKRLFETDFPRLKEKKELFNLEREFIRKDGTIFPANLNVFSVYDENGKFIGTKTIARDTTQLKQIEDALIESEHQIRMITDNIPALVSYIDIYGCYKFVNVRYEEWFGISRSEIIGKHIREVLGDDAYICIEKYIEQAFSGHPVSFEYNIPYLYSGKRWVNVQYIPDIGEEDEDKVKGCYALVTDITEHKKAVEELKESEERLRSLANAAFEAILFHKDGVLLRANKQFFDMFGYEPEELLGEQIIPIVVAPEARAFMRNHIAEGRKVMYESKGLKKDGTKFPMDIRIREAELDGEKIRIATLMDITERKQAEERLKKTHEQLRALSSRVSEVEEAERKRLAQELHDQVGQNLTAFGINLNTLTTLISRGETAKINDWVKDMQKLLEETTQSIRNIMADLRPPVLDDYGLLAGIRWFSAQFSERTGISVKITGKKLRSGLSGFLETTLYRITQEALTNVSKHAGASEVNIRISEAKDSVILTITDDGKGFNPETVYKEKKQTVWGLLTIKERAEAIGG